jgi:hypothetical protein
VKKREKVCEGFRFSHRVDSNKSNNPSMCAAQVSWTLV